MKNFAMGIVASMALVAGTANAGLVFDNMTAPQAAGHISSTSSTPNTFMGGAYNLAAGTTNITGFDIYPVNLSGTNFNALKITMYVWDTVNLGTVDATHPAFSNLLATYTLTSTGTFSTGFYYSYEGSPVGVNSGITLGAPLALADTQIGITFNYQGSTNGGVTYANANSLTSLISHTEAPTVGSNVFNGYYRNAASETNGNFVSTLRSLGLNNQSVALRVYGAPTPGALSLIGLGGLVAGRGRR